MGQSKRLLPLLDRRDRIPVEVGVGGGFEVAELRQRGLQLSHVLTVAHALLERAPDGGGAVEQIGVVPGDRVHV